MRASYYSHKNLKSFQGIFSIENCSCQKMNAFGKFNNNSTKKKTKESLSVEYRFFVMITRVDSNIFIYPCMQKKILRHDGEFPLAGSICSL